jgi:hypothetical protein
MYVNVGFCAFESTVPSFSKSHAHEVGPPLEVSVKLTVSGAVPPVGEAVKDAVGGSGPPPGRGR